MKKISNFICGFLLAFCGMAASLSGKIIDSADIQAMIPYINQDSFVFLNVTGTLYGPSNTLSDHQWREYFSSRVKDLVDDLDKAQELIDKVKNQIVNHIPKRNIQEITPQLIHHLQDKRIVVFGITRKQVSTSYADNFGAITDKHVLSLGIQLEKTISYFPIPKEISEQDGYTFMYGILFTNKQPVGPVLVSFLNKAGPKPYNIVMVDNSLASLENVQEALKPTGITFTGIRYGGMDALEETFDPTLGIIEFFAFINEGKILSDKEAAANKPYDKTIDYEALLDKYIQEAIQD